MRRLATVLLAALVVAGGLVVSASPPAQAQSYCANRSIGQGPSVVSLTACKGDSVVDDNSYYELTTLVIGPASTRATGCSLSQWTRLFGYGNAWNGPATVHNCRQALRTGVVNYYSGRGSRTTARAMIVHTCLTFFYGSVKGVPFCAQSQLAGV